MARISPTVETLRHLAEAAGERLLIDSQPDSSVSLVGLGRAVAGPHGRRDAIRLAAEFAARFRSSQPDDRRRMLAAEPRPIGDDRWDAFLGAVAEWLAVAAGDPTPKWAFDESRYLRRGWWPSDNRSMDAWEYAGAPLAFKLRGVYIHRDSLTNV